MTTDPRNAEAYSDPIGEMASRYEYDYLAQLLLLTEQLDIAASLLSAESIANARAALILLDHHAEILLRRHSEATFRAGDGTGPRVRRAYTEDERNEVRRQFTRKVDVAAGIGTLREEVSPLIDLDVAACLKLAHRHRNAAYHRDDHNPGVLYLISLLQFDAVCRLLPAITPGVGVHVEELPDALARHDVAAGPAHGLRHGVWLPDAAQTVADSLRHGLELPLGQRRDPDDPAGRLSDEVEADMAEANALRNERVVELRSRFRPKARQKHVFNAINEAEKLLHDPTLADALGRYDRLDRNLAPFERYLPEAVRAWDEIVERQVDAAREA